MNSSKWNRAGWGRRLLTQDSGSAAMECAALTAFIVVALLCVSLQTSLQFVDVFDSVSRSVNVNDAITNAHGSSTDATQAAPYENNPRSLTYNGVMLLLLTLALGGWIAERRARDRKAASADKALAVDLTGSRDAPDGDVSRSRFAKKRLQILNLLMNDGNKLLPSDLRVGDLMTTTVKTCPPSATAEELRAVVSEQKIRHVLIADGGTLLGIVSDRDLRNVDGATRASKFMIDHPRTVTSDTLVNSAISLLLYGHFSSLPVVDAGKLVGIITTTDVVMTLQCTMLAVEKMVHSLGTRHEHPELDTPVF